MEKFEVKLNELLHKSLPPEIEAQCKFCKGESKYENDRNCYRYVTQMQITYYMACTEFVNLVLRNKHILNDKESLKELTMNFFGCLHFVQDKGILYLDLDKLAQYTLKAGFNSLSKMFNESHALRNLRLINDGLNGIEKKQMDNRLSNREDVDYLNVQKEYLENKQRYYKEDLLLDNLEHKEAHKKGGKGKKGKGKKTPTVMQYALFYYFLQAVNLHDMFENHKHGKLAAITEIAEELGVSVKNFQLMYNEIHLHSVDRVSKKHAHNISFVANNMLKGYPKAQELAFSEFKEAQTKNK